MNISDIKFKRNENTGYDAAHPSWDVVSRASGDVIGRVDGFVTGTFNEWNAVIDGNRGFGHSRKSAVIDALDVSTGLYE